MQDDSTLTGLVPGLNGVIVVDSSLALPGTFLVQHLLRWALQSGRKVGLPQPALERTYACLQQLRCALLQVVLVTAELTPERVQAVVKRAVRRRLLSLGPSQNSKSKRS